MEWVEWHKGDVSLIFSKKFLFAVVYHQFFVLFAAIEVTYGNPSVPKTLLKILDNRYDSNALPTQNKSYPTNVTISMYIEGLSSFQASTMDFHVDIYFQERWVDRRLRHTGRDKILIRDAKIFDRMWHPDLYFANARTSEFHYVTSPNFFAWVYPNGTVYYDTRISLTVMCMMDLYKYPLDRQVCDIRILSYAYDETQVKIKWLDNSPIVRNDIIKLPDMELASITTGECNGEYAIGKWSCVTAVFVVNRAITHHILQSYIPTALMVIISWFSFWLDVDSVPGRVSLCITTLLTLATQASAARLALPQVSYIKAIDVWMGVCLAFVFGVMIEFTIVNYWSRRKPSVKNCPDHLRMATVQPSSLKQRLRKKLRLQINNGGYIIAQDATLAQNNETGTGAGSSAGLDLRCQPAVRPTPPPNNERDDVRRTNRLRVLMKQNNRKTANMIDQKCRIIFPVTFLIFNLIYWPYYLFAMT